MLLKNGSVIKNDVIDAFNRAVEKQENLNSDGSINWNFVESDMYMDLRIFYDGEYITECFDACADEYDWVMGLGNYAEEVA